MRLERTPADSHALCPPHLAPAGLLNLAAATILLALLACSGLSSDLLSLLQLVELPTVTLKASVGGLILLDAAACVSWEWVLRRVFGVGVPVRAPSGGDGA